MTQFRYRLSYKKNRLSCRVVVHLLCRIVAEAISRIQYCLKCGFINASNLFLMMAIYGLFFVYLQSYQTSLQFHNK